MNAYLGMLDNHGGYIKVNDDFTKDENLLSMVVDGNTIYPCFQFTKNSFSVQIDGFAYLLQSITTNVSNIRKGNFFTQKFGYTKDSDERVYQVLRRGASVDEWNVLVMMAKNFGTNNLM